MKFAMCNEFCEGWGFAATCLLAAEAGYEGIEIAPFTLAESVLEVTAAERNDLRRTAETCGLAVVGLHWLLVGPKGLHLNHPDAAVRGKTKDYLKAEIDLCAELGGRIMVVGSPSQRTVIDGETYEATWDRTVDVMRALAGYAADRQVCICIEPLTSEETNFINTADEARRLVEEVSHPAFQMMLDVKAMAAGEEPIERVIRKHAACVKHFHANDENRMGPGFGETDFVPIARALREVGYEGFVSVEVFDFSAGPERIARESLRYLQEAFGQDHG